MRGFIYIDNELIYIGKTTRSPYEHIKGVYSLRSKENKWNKPLYDAIGFRLYSKTKNITNYELETKEKELIEQYKPKYNREGVTGIVIMLLWKEKLESLLQQALAKKEINKLEAWQILDEKLNCLDEETK